MPPDAPGYVADLLIDEGGLRRGLDAVVDELDRRGVGRSVHLVGILNGCCLFAADLARALDARGYRVESVQFVDAKSYTGTRQSDEVEVALGSLDLDRAQPGQTALVADTVYESGRTLRAVGKALRARYPDLTFVPVVMLDKSGGAAGPDMVRAYAADPGAFLVGYGLDLDGRFRALPRVYALRESADGDVKR